MYIHMHYMHIYHVNQTMRLHSRDAIARQQSDDDDGVDGESVCGVDVAAVIESKQQHMRDKFTHKHIFTYTRNFDGFPFGKI